MYEILINDDGDIYFYSQGREIKDYATKEEALEEIKELQAMELKLFDSNQIEYKVVKVNE